MVHQGLLGRGVLALAAVLALISFRDNIVLWGGYRDYIGDNGTENGNYHLGVWGRYRDYIGDTGKENGNYYLGTLHG